MPSFNDLLEVPIIAAPMAGGPSTPELCAAVAQKGALGFLAAGYMSAEDFRKRIDQTRALTDAPFGVNVFVPPNDYRQPKQGDQGKLASEVEFKNYRNFRQLLIDDGVGSAEDFQEFPDFSNHDYYAKIDVVVETSPPVVSFTFGLPSVEVMQRVKDAGCLTVLQATTPAGIKAALALEPDAVAIQSISAGGHRAALDGIEDGTEDAALLDLVKQVRAMTTLPLIAAGGVSGPEDVAALLDGGADAVQVGTLFMTAEEAATNDTHRKALLELKDRGTMMTRTFSGKLARTIKNEFALKYSDMAPALYPAVNTLTSKVKARARQAGDPENLHLWAGTGYTECQAVPAADVIDYLLGSTVAN